MYTDRSIACADCGQEFTFTAGEQEFYAQRGFTESPKRCPSCRQIRKAQRNRGDRRLTAAPRGEATATAVYNGGSYGSGGYSTAAAIRRRATRRAAATRPAVTRPAATRPACSERRPREMFEAVCANCGKTASVPFRPSGSKPVYCSDCFEAPLSRSGLGIARVVLHSADKPADKSAHKRRDNGSFLTSCAPIPAVAGQSDPVE